MSARERAVARRELRLRAREQAEVATRDAARELREEALRARADADAARLAREHLMVQMREANERLVLATLHADELLEQAMTARAVAADSAALEAEGRRRAETLATQLMASEHALRASESEAQASSRAKDEFIAMLGHELRGPLAPILLALDLIAMDSADSHKREHKIIENQTRQLVRLVDELLDVARIRTGKIELQRQPVELTEVVSRAVETARPLIEAKGHALRVDVAPAGLTIDGDLLRLTQAVSNLLTNAAKYTPSGGSIGVTTQRRGPVVSLHVSDTGIGISSAMLPRIFDLFAQEQQPSDRAPGGLGLGLAIVRSLVELHGGTVTARSDGLGRGSEFVIEIPLLVRRSDAATASTPALVASVSSPARRILVVDDNRLLAELTSVALRKLGHVVRVAFDGPSALSVIEGFVPEVVLLDIGLPGMDGYEVAQRVRAALSPRELHFIAITGYGQPVDRRRSADAGFDEHLVKPVDIGTLQRSIDSAVATGAVLR